MGIALCTSTAQRAIGAIAVAAGIFLAGGAAAADAATPCPATVVCRAEPFFADGGGVGSEALDALGSTAAPDDDLFAVLSDLADAKAHGDDAKADVATRRARAIILGDPSQLGAEDEDFLANKAYGPDGTSPAIGLLNTKPKVQEVPAGTTTVDVREIRFGDHALLDTSMLRFADMDAPFTIRWHITELGTSFGGELTPVGIPASGPATQEPVDDLVLPSFFTGTTATQRFHPAGADEETRLGTQIVSVTMPAPKDITGGILDPNLKAGHETYAQIAVAPSIPDAQPTPKLPTVGEISDASPEKQILDGLDQGTDPTALLDMVGKLRSRDTLPIATDAAGADAAVTFANSEAYVSKRSLRLAPDGSMTVALTNRDGIARKVDLRQLTDRSKVDAAGVLNWGSFTTDVVGDPVDLPANMTEPKVVTIKPAAGAFSLWIGDPDGGDQAGMAIALDRGPRQQSLEIGLGPVKPLHEALDKNGDLWVTLANSDEVVRLHPTAGALSSSAPEHFLLPGGVANDPNAAGQPPVPALGPGDVAVDAHGIVWVTLTLGNAIVRIDPKVADAGTGAGITKLPLEGCTTATCRAPIAVVGAAAPLSRLPLQMKVRDDGHGNTDLFFTEQAADAIGALRVDANGHVIAERHFSCVCMQPLGIALAPNGDIWYSEGTSNRLGRMTLDVKNPFGVLPKPLHYNIPNPVLEATPGAQPSNCGGPTQPECPPAAPLPPVANTTLPHSVAIDRKGRIWYTGEASETVGYLDPAKAVPNKTQGFHDTFGPENEFGRALAPADLAIAPDGTAYIADEYGDQIATATVAANGDVVAKFGFRPTGRNSLTDSPMVDAAGNLWFVEGGANLVTRISGVACAADCPGALPLPRGTAPDAPVLAGATTTTPAPAASTPAAPATPAASANPGATTPAATDKRVECTASTQWLARTGAGRNVRRTLPLLGMTAKSVEACLGRPAGTKRTTRGGVADVWSYPTLSLRFSRGRVSGFTLGHAGLRSTPDRAGVGASLGAFRRALGSVARAGRQYRAVVGVGTKDAADVRLTVSRSGKVTKVTVTMLRRSALDTAGKTLLRRAG
jgi:streptogramin lyase